MKNKLRVLLLSTFAIITHFFRKIGLIKIAKTAVILPPASPGSLGDEVLVLSLCNELKKNEIEQVLILDQVKDNSWSYLNLIHSSYYFNNFSINMKDFISGIFLIWKIRSYRYFYCIGADTLDGFYGNWVSLTRLSIVRYAHRIGLLCTITGFSYNENPTIESVNALSELEPSIRVCVRDPISYKRVTQIRKAIQVSDLAFLYEKVTNSSNISETTFWIETQKIEGRSIMGVNLSPISIFKKTDIVSSILDELSETLNRIIETTSTSLVFIPHDFREGNLSDRLIIENVIKGINSKFHVHFVNKHLLPEEIRSIASECDVALSGRMHFSIACFTQSIPVISISYQSKFSGLYEFFGLRNLEIANWTNQDDLCSQIEESILYIRDNKENIKNKIDSTLPLLKKISRDNIWADL